MKSDYDRRPINIFCNNKLKTKDYVDCIVENNNEKGHNDNRNEDTCLVCTDVYTDDQVNEFTDEDGTKLVSMNKNISLWFFFIEGFHTFEPKIDIID